MIVLDHIAVACETLDAGREWVEQALGFSMVGGGKHALMGTHNFLLGLADELYLEVIAIDPDTPSPNRPRWFNLDHFTGPPRLTNWICRTDDLDNLLMHMPNGAGIPVGLTRDTLSWRLAVPPSGLLPYDQAFPALIEWQNSHHPAKVLAPSECRLTQLQVRHPYAGELKQTLRAYLKDDRIKFTIGSASITAEFDTPAGRKVLK